MTTYLLLAIVAGVAVARIVLRRPLWPWLPAFDSPGKINPDETIPDPPADGRGGYRAAEGEAAPRGGGWLPVVFVDEDDMTTGVESLDPADVEVSYWNHGSLVRRNVETFGWKELTNGHYRIGLPGEVFTNEGPLGFSVSAPGCLPFVDTVLDAEPVRLRDSEGRFTTPEKLEAARFPECDGTEEGPAPWLLSRETIAAQAGLDWDEEKGRVRTEPPQNNIFTKVYLGASSVDLEGYKGKLVLDRDGETPIGVVTDCDAHGNATIALTGNLQFDAGDDIGIGGFRDPDDGSLSTEEKAALAGVIRDWMGDTPKDTGPHVEAPEIEPEAAQTSQESDDDEGDDDPPTRLEVISRCLVAAANAGISVRETSNALLSMVSVLNGRGDPDPRNDWPTEEQARAEVRKWGHDAGKAAAEELNRAVFESLAPPEPGTVTIEADGTRVTASISLDTDTEQRFQQTIQVYEAIDKLGMAGEVNPQTITFHSPDEGGGTYGRR